MSREALVGLVRGLRARLEIPDEDDGFFCAGPRSLGKREAPSAVVSRPAAAVEEASSDDRAARLEDLRAQVLACRRCPLGSQRLNPAFGVGSPNARVVFIGEGPGYEEDRRGEPFVGKAGQLLDKILASIGLSRETVYIANVVKCHPMKDPSDPGLRGNDRPPTPEESALCRGTLEEQLRIIRPEFIVALGSVAAKALLDTREGITKIRGQWREFRLGDPEAVFPLLPTYHPAALLRDPALKREVWEDMKSLRTRLEEKP
ncbi:MAG: uracil-DNA glycosylase [Elusimicrobiota bacterium]